jgi:transcriptional regulator with XRE-family HTH domain
MPHRKNSSRKYQRTFLREWRDYRNLTIDRLSERVEISGATISRIERGLQPYSQPILEALADALGCGVADLIAHPPAQKDGELLDLVRSLPTERREQIKKIIKALTDAA